MSMRHGSSSSRAPGPSAVSATSVGRTPTGAAAWRTRRVAARDRGGGRSERGPRPAELDLEPAVGHHGASRRRVRDVLDGQPQRHVVVGVGEPEQPLLGRDRHPGGRDGVRAVGGDRQEDAGLRAVGVDAAQDVHQLHAGDVVELGAQRRQVVDQDDRGRVRTGRRPPPVELAAQPADQPHLALAVAGQDHRAGVRERLERLQLARAEVERVDLELVGRVDAREAEHEARQRGRRPAAGDAEEQEVALVEVPADRVLGLPARLVGQRDQRPGAVAGGERRRGRSAPGSGSGHGLRGGAMPSAALASMIASTSRARSDGRSTPPGSIGPLAAPAAVRPELERGDLDRRVALGVGDARDQRALDRHDLVRAEPHVRAPGPVAADVRGGAVADHVGRVRGVLHAQGDPQVGVGPDVVVDHARGTLRGEDQVHAERAAALGDVDERRQQLRLLAGHLGELVDHDHQPRQRLGLRRALRRRAGCRRRRCAAAARGTGARPRARAAPARRAPRRGR